MTTPARFKLAKTYNVDFLHDAGLAEMTIAISDARIAISGKVLAADSTPLAGAVVTTADSIPVPEIDCENLTERNVGTSFDNYSIPFVPSKKFITKVDASVFLKGDPGVLTIAVLDENKKVLVEKEFAQSNFSISFKWIGYDLDAPLAVTPGQKYYINLSAFKDEDNCYYYKKDYNDKPAYQVLGTNDYFTTTDADGKYTFPVEKYSSGQLYAFLGNKEFDVAMFDNIAENQANKDIIELGDVVVEISGKVFDADSVPVEGVVVTVASNKPELAVDQENTDDSGSGYWIKTNGSTTQSFIPQKQYISQVDIDVFSRGNPGNLKVAILDKNKKEIGFATINYTQIASDWTEIKFDELLKVTPNETHYIALTADKYENENHICYCYDNSTDENMVYRVWSYDDYFTSTDANGNYTFKTDKNWSGTLHAYYSGKSFNNLTFTKISHSDSDKNFKENESDITTDYTLKSISLTPPTKTEYIIGESIDRTGMVVTGTYSDGSTAKINKYEISGFATDIVGEKTVTVSVNDLSATYKINVKTNKYSITYKSDSVVYTKVDHILGMSVKVAENPTKTGYTFIGWTPDVPLRMPEEDLTVDAVWQINDYTLTYKVEDTVYQSLQVTYNDTIDSIAVPVKTGYTFIGWTGLPETMPAMDTTVEAAWQINDYTLTFKVEDTVYLSLQVTYNDTIDSIAVAPVKTGYTFTGWSAQIPEVMPAEDLTFDAVWQINDYTLTYKVEDTVYQSVIVTYNEKIDSIAAPTKVGYTFRGWAGLPETMPATNTTVEAQWQINSYVITFNTDGGSTVSEMTVEYNSVIVAPKEPTKEGYIFDGWVPAIPTTGVTGDMTFTAKWVAVPEPGTSVGDNAIAEINIFAYGNTIVVENADSDILVYSAMGQLVNRTISNGLRNEITINGTGIYIVKVGNIAKRVAIRN